MKRHLRNSRAQRGAALLIVTVVITLLSIVGAFAARSTGRVTRAAGQARQTTATRHIAEQGVRAMATRAAIKAPFSARARGSDPGLEPVCKSTFFQRSAVERPEAIERCAMLRSDKLAEAWQVPLVEDLDASGRQLVRKFEIEVTDETDWGARAGEDASRGRQSKRVTAHVRSVVGPWTTDFACGSQDSLSKRGQSSSYEVLGTLVYPAPR